jgi:N-acetyl-gamma-glutamyl-phosphate reductase
LGGTAKGAAFHEALADYYAGQALIEVVASTERPAPRPHADSFAGSDKMELRVFYDDAKGHALLMARLDNLGKGASGAAVQNLRLMLGL